MKYRVSGSWIRCLKQRRRESGEVAPRRAGQAAEPKWLAHCERPEELVRVQPDATVPNCVSGWGFDINVQTLSRALPLTSPKSLVCLEARPPRCPRAPCRLASRGDRSRSTSRLVFLDETWASTNMTSALRPLRAKSLLHPDAINASRGWKTLPVMRFSRNSQYRLCLAHSLNRWIAEGNSSERHAKGITEGWL